MYCYKLPLINNSSTSKKITLYLCSNDIFNVDTLAGVWLNNETLLHCRVPMFPKEKHWRVFSLILQPGEVSDIEFTIVPLGSRWGGMIASLAIETGA